MVLRNDMNITKDIHLQKKKKRVDIYVYQIAADRAWWGYDSHSLSVIQVSHSNTTRTEAGWYPANNTRGVIKCHRVSQGTATLPICVYI